MDRPITPVPIQPRFLDSMLIPFWVGAMDNSCLFLPQNDVRYNNHLGLKMAGSKRKYSWTIGRIWFRLLA
jgi:hypothetical protein